MGTRCAAPTNEGVECRQARAGKQPGPAAAAAAAVTAPHAALHRALQLFCIRSLLASARQQPATPILDPTQPATASIALSLRHRCVHKLGLHFGRTGASVEWLLLLPAARCVHPAQVTRVSCRLVVLEMNNSLHRMDCCSCTGDSRLHLLPRALRAALQGLPFKVMASTCEKQQLNHQPMDRKQHVNPESRSTDASCGGGTGGGWRGTMGISHKLAARRAPPPWSSSPAHVHP